MKRRNFFGAIAAALIPASLISKSEGAVANPIRLWKLGDAEKGLYPSQKAVESLRRALEQLPNDGTFDLIWGPDLDVTEVRGKTVEQIKVMVNGQNMV